MAVERDSRILVVEDEALIMMATVDMLRELGHETITARCAAAALAASDRTPELTAMVTDLNLPDTDGQMLAAEMRRRRPGLPVVFATGYRIAIASVVANGGPTAILNKPFVTKELAAALRRVLPSVAPAR
jgi:CheY-like chemotaxis protein